MLNSRQVNAFLNRAHTSYSFPIELRSLLRFFLKSINLKYSTMSPNNCSTDVRTLDRTLLKVSICAVRAAPLFWVCGDVFESRHLRRVFGRARKACNCNDKNLASKIQNVCGIFITESDSLSTLICRKCVGLVSKASELIQTKKSNYAKAAGTKVLEESLGESVDGPARLLHSRNEKTVKPV